MTVLSQDHSLDFAKRWCAHKQGVWKAIDELGRGGTATVYLLRSESKEYALKVYDEAFSSAEKGRLEESRINQQVQLGQHTCPSLVRIFDGGRFEERLFVLMNRIPGYELEKVLPDVPRNKIRGILDQIARAVSFLRQNRLCHRDVKSANVVVSHDFERATLLDLSVTRDIYDPVGLGTDHEGQLPVVATARYSPPEYLFRLLEPGPSLWHALDVYQLGALLCDLISRRPLFQAEYVRSKNNRYRFAWVVATVEPEVAATDVDKDLVFLARRALDKDWERRSRLRLEDFFDEAAILRAHAMQLIGLGQSALTRNAIVRPTKCDQQKLSSVAAALEEGLLGYFESVGLMARHSVDWGPSDSIREIRFKWKSGQTLPDAAATETQFSVRLSLNQGPNGWAFEAMASIGGLSGDWPPVHIDLPPVADSKDTVARLLEQCQSALPELAVLATRTESTGG